jgi:putative FmdB family regulatory protein
MIDFKCNSCSHEFEECVEAKNGLAAMEKCPKCGNRASMIMDINKRVHRNGNRYRDVSWSTWNIN